MLPFGCGLVVGLSHVVLGFPFDLLKAKCQVASSKFSMTSYLTEVWQKGGLRGFYKGALPSLLSLPFITGFQFGVYEYLKRAFTKVSLHYGQPTVDHLHAFGCAGMVAGLISSLAYCPMELMKIRTQLGGEGMASSLHSGLCSQIRDGNTLGIREMFRGLNLTCLRQSIGCYAYFYSYEAAVHNLCRRKNIDRKFADFKDFALGGAAAGLCYWSVAYPLDYLKTRTQLDMQLLNLSKDLVKPACSGYLIAVWRGVFVNAVSFSLYEQIKGLAQIFAYIAEQ